MFKRGAVFANVPNVLLYMRINHMYERRGGLKYAKAIIMFYKKMYTNKLITMSQFLTAVGIRVIISLIPAKARQYLYETGLRKH